MKPGPELDSLIAKRVMNIPPDYACTPGFIDTGKDWVQEWDNLKPYSTDIAVAWLVVEKMISDDNEFELTTYFPCTQLVFWCRFSADMNFDHIGEADTAPHAICLAALKAKGIEV